MNLTRRACIVRSGGLLALLALPAGCDSNLSGKASSPGDEIRRIARELRGFDPAIGTSSVASETPEELVESIVAALRPRLDSGESVEEALQATIAQEHAGDAIVDVEGWALSETESRLVGLSLMLHAEAGTPTSSAERPFDAMELAEVALVERWGPAATCVGKPFNMQLDGHSSLWVVLQGEAPPAIQVAIGDLLLPTTRSGSLLTTRIDAEELHTITREAGALPVWLFDSQLERRQKIGEFVVEVSAEPAALEDGSPSKSFQRVKGWGPRSTKVLTPFNLVPDGASAFWIQSPCAPASTQAYLGSSRLRTVVGKDVVTASLFGLEELKEPKDLPLFLVDTANDERVLVGMFQVLP